MIQATAARTGFAAEKIVCTQTLVRTVLQLHFNKPIQSISVIKGNKKSDNRVTFEDGSTLNLQVKNGTSQAHHVDRRPVERIPECIRSMASYVCLSRTEQAEYIVPTCQEWIEVVNELFLGTEREFIPDYLLLTEVNEGQIISMSIESIPNFMQVVKNNAFDSVRIGDRGHTITGGPEFALQRRGGEGKREDGTPKGRPDDIQLKLKTGKYIMESHSFTKLI
jgi:hypothetical protein